MWITVTTDCVEPIKFQLTAEQKGGLWPSVHNKVKSRGSFVHAICGRFQYCVRVSLSSDSDYWMFVTHVYQLHFIFRFIPFRTQFHLFVLNTVSALPQRKSQLKIVFLLGMLQLTGFNDSIGDLSILTISETDLKACRERYRIAYMTCLPQSCLTLYLVLVK